MVVFFYIERSGRNEAFKDNISAIVAIGGFMRADWHGGLVGLEMCVQMW